MAGRDLGQQAATLLSLLASTTHAVTDGRVEPPLVLVSIKPLELIAAAITEGVSKPELLLPPGSSSHDYSLRPSDVRKLTSADLVFWIGPEMESFLVKVFKRHVGEHKETALIDSQGVKTSELLSAERERVEEHGHDHGSHDPHIESTSQ